MLAGVPMQVSLCLHPTILVDLDLQLHHAVYCTFTSASPPPRRIALRASVHSLATRRCANEPGADVDVLLVEGADLDVWEGGSCTRQRMQEPTPGSTTAPDDA